MATATVYGANYSVAANVTPSTALEACKWQGKERVLADTTTIGLATADAGSLLYIGILPAGAVVSDVQVVSNTTAAVTGTVGYSGDADALGTLTTLANSLTTAQPVSCLPTIGETPTTEDKKIYITTAGAALIASEIVRTRIRYVLE